MTPDKRLDQLEPVLGEAVAQLDLHTAQLKRANTGIVILIEATTRQSDDISFVLRGQADQREQIAKLIAGQTALEAGQTALEAGQAKLEAGQAKLEAGQAATNERLDGFGQTLLAILNAVQKPSGN